MLKILNKNKDPVYALDRYEDYRITKVLSCDDKTLEFTALILDIPDLAPEWYVETKDQRFVVKDVKPSWTGTATVFAQLDVEELTGKAWPFFETVEQTLGNAISLDVATTGWQVLVDESVGSKKRTLRKTRCSAFDVMKQALSVYRCEVNVDSVNKTLTFKKEIGSDKGVYFTTELNLQSLEKSQTSYDFYTVIYPYGKDGTTIEECNDGSDHLSNFDYSDKVIEYIWKDDRYTIPESLMEDAQAMLDDHSKPYVSYTASVLDLAKMSSKYSILDYDIGDTVTLIDSASGTREKQRIVEMVVYPDEPEKNTCVFANTVLSFEELSAKYSEAAETIDNVTTSNGTVDGSKVEGLKASQITNLESAIIGSAAIAEALVGFLGANYAEIDLANVNNAFIEDGQLKNAIIDTAHIKTAAITTVCIADEAVIDSKIANVSANKLTAGTIDAGTIEVVNLNAANITVGKINGVQIAAGTLTRDNMGSTFLEEVDSKVEEYIEYYISWDSDAEEDAPGASAPGWDTVVPQREDGKYIWKMTDTVYGNGSHVLGLPVCLSGTDGAAGEDATLLRIDSSRGNMFKNNAVSTTLTVTIYRGPDRITNISDLRSTFGSGAYLQWYYQMMESSTWGEISQSDTRLANNGFSFTISPNDVDVKVNFRCDLMI